MSVGYRFGMVVATMLFCFGGCAQSSPPVQDLKIARMALVNAEEAKESSAAASAYARAQKLLFEAQKKMEAKEYDAAKRLAQKATADARLAKIEASNAELEAQIVKLERTLKMLRKEFAVVEEGEKR